MKQIAITGTSRGLGRALVEQWCQMGHRVHGGARTPAAELGFTPSGTYRAVDVSQAESVEQWFQALPEVPDLVVANAGVINTNAPLWEVPEEEFRSVLDANVTGVYLTLKSFMRRANGERPRVFVALSSTWGRTTSPEVAPYCASKWAVEGMIRSLAQEVPPWLSVVALNPGVINTDMLAQCFGSGASHYWNAQEWAREAAPRILSYGRNDNGASLSI